MTFKVAARTLLQLGAELISSDGVAFYELIKNGLDAGSRFVRLDVVVALPHPAFRTLCDELVSVRSSPNQNGARHEVSIGSLEKYRELSCAAIDASAPTAGEALSRLRRVGTWSELELELERINSELNYIKVSDTGSGMSLQDLVDIYLTIGTPSRLVERAKWRAESVIGQQPSRQRPILGEKGVGRLSAMRLGDHLHVKTSRAGETRWNMLDIDWTRFTEDVNATIDEIAVEPILGDPKEDPSASGTMITISELSSTWSKDKLEAIVRREFSKLVDPFSPGVRFPVKPFFNNQELEIPRFNRLLFDHAHATISATYAVDPEPRVSGRIWYVGNRKAPGDERETTFELGGTHLVSAVGGMLPDGDVSADTLRSLGPFRLTLYWYNRQRLDAIEGIGTSTAVRDLLSHWTGGVMVFRNGFRVSPYGDADDDWLDLDRRALAGQSFKVNRAQIIGKVDISSSGNPNLVDQTNREGLRDTVEKRVLVRLLKWILEVQLLGFLNSVDKEKPARDRVDLDDLQARVDIQDRNLDETLAQFSREYPDLNRKYRLKQLVDENRQILRSTMAEVRQRADAYETGRAQLVHLAGIGLLVEILAHELNRATAHTLNTLTEAERQNVPVHLARVFTSLEAQLRSLQKRLRTLDPLSTRARQVKEWFDLVTWVQGVLEGHRPQFQRHSIQLSFRTAPEKNAQLRMRAVKGMIVQIIENLISNSVYWLDQQRRLDPAFQPRIDVVVDTAAKQIRFSDNGSGVEPARSELIFQAFHSTKPVGAGSGLGLFIAREIAEYHNGSLYLDPRPSSTDGTLHTFVLNLQPSQDVSPGGVV